MRSPIMTREPTGNNSIGCGCWLAVSGIIMVCLFSGLCVGIWVTIPWIDDELDSRDCDNSCFGQCRISSAVNPNQTPKGKARHKLPLAQNIYKSECAPKDARQGSASALQIRIDSISQACGGHLLAQMGRRSKGSYPRVETRFNGDSSIGL